MHLRTGWPVSRVRRFCAVVRAAVRTAAQPRRWGPFRQAFEETHFEHSFSPSFSQGGEDLALLQLFGTRIGRFLDIGAHDPLRFSVTQRLYLKGWSGVNVEANEEALRRFELLRPRDTNICAAIGDPMQGETRQFSYFREGALSTMNPQWRDQFLQEGNTEERRRTVRVLSLKEICQQHFADEKIDLLNVDCEGSDLEILQSGNWDKFRPRSVCVESPRHTSELQLAPPVRFLVEAGYEIWCILPMSTICIDPNQIPIEA